MSNGPKTDLLDIAGGVATVVLALILFDVAPEWLEILFWPALVLLTIDMIWLFAVRMPRWNQGDATPPDDATPERSEDSEKRDKA